MQGPIAARACVAVCALAMAAGGRADNANANPAIKLDNGVMMPTLALGTGGFDNATAADAITKAFSAGLMHVHSAYDYFNLPGVGKGLASRPRSEVFVTAMTSPCIHTAAPPVRNVTDPQKCTELTAAELNQTLDLLGLDYVDLVLLHGPSEPFGFEGACSKDICAVNQAQWLAYQQFLKQGKARAIGVSNYCQSCLNCLLADPTTTVKPAVNQFQLHVGTGPDPEQLVSFCDNLNITVQAYSPLAAGALITDKFTAKVAARYGKSAAQVGMRWVVQHPGVAAVVKADNAAYIAEDMGIFDWELKELDVDLLNTRTTPTGQQDGRPSWGCAK